MFKALLISIVLSFLFPSQVYLEILNNNDGTYSVLYDSDTAIGGFQMSVDGTLSGARGGDAEGADFTISIGGKIVLAFSLEGASIPAGDGTLVILEGSDISKVYDMTFSSIEGESMPVSKEVFVETIDRVQLSPSKKKLALIDFEHIGVKKSDARALSKRLTAEIVKINKYIMVERSAMEKILEEQKFQTASGNVTNDVVDIGNMVGADFIIYGSISKVGSTYSVDSRIISTKTAEVIRSATFDSSVLDKLVKKGMRDIAYQLCDVDKPNPKKKKNSDKNRGDIEKVQTPRYTPPQEEDLSEAESWYFYLSYGLVSNYKASYWDRYSYTLSELERYRTKDDTDGYFEVGAYWHLTQTSLWGVLLESSITERVFESNGNEEVWPFVSWEDDSKVLLALSAIAYLDKFEKGWYLKADYGFSSLRKESSYFLNSLEVGVFSYDYTDTFLGTGYNLEIGYSLDLGGTRLVSSLGYSNRLYDFDKRELISYVEGAERLSNLEYSSFEDLKSNEFWSVEYRDYHDLSYYSFVLKVGLIF